MGKRGGGDEPSCSSAATVGMVTAGHASRGAGVEKCLLVSPSFCNFKVKSTSALLWDVPFRNTVNF